MKMMDKPAYIVFSVSAILLYVIPPVFGDGLLLMLNRYVDWIMHIFPLFSVISEASVNSNDYKIFFSFVLFLIPACVYIYYMKPLEINYAKLNKNKTLSIFMLTIFLPFLLIVFTLAVLNVDHVPKTIIAYKIVSLMSASKVGLIIIFGSIVVFYSLAIAIIITWFVNFRKYVLS